MAFKKVELEIKATPGLRKVEHRVVKLLIFQVNIQSQVGDWTNFSK